MIPKVAILVDGGFYRRRAYSLFGDVSGADRADELFRYCLAHVDSEAVARKNNTVFRELYRIFYYDCPPLSLSLFNPIARKTTDFSKTETYKWTKDFLDRLTQKRKVALRLGKLAVHSPYVLGYDLVKKLSAGTITWSDIGPNDLTLNIEQKGVDMRIGVDIASLAFKKQVDKIVLISGDSDFVPAAKLARREGIDFILDSMGAHIADDLFTHIDGKRSQIKSFIRKQEE